MTAAALEAQANVESIPASGPVETAVSTARPEQQAEAFLQTSQAADLRSFPDDLKTRRVWVGWRYETRDNSPKSTKVPYRAHDTQTKADCTDPTTWAPFELAQARKACFDGIGFCTEGDVTGIDFDDCIDEAGQIDPQVWAEVQTFDSYTEQTPSGRGLRVLIAASFDGPGHNLREVNREVYCRVRFFTVTGAHLEGTPATINPRQEQLDQWLDRYCPPATEAQKHSLPSQPVELGDRELLDFAFGKSGGAILADLFTGNWQGHFPSQSEADASLLWRLAFWTGRDPARMESLARSSGLAREKWDTPRKGRTSTWLREEIGKACAACTDCYTPRPKGRDLTVGDVTMSEELPPLPVEARGFSLSDSGNAERLVAHHGADLRYCKLWSSWLVWDGRRWARDETREVERRAKATVHRIIHEAQYESVDEKKALICKWAGTSLSEQKRKAMVNLAGAEDEVKATPEEFDRDPILLTVNNGTLDLRTGKLLGHDRGHLVTKLAPVDFDPNAECPLWMAFLDRIMGENEGLTSFLQRAVGYSLTGDTSEQCLFLLYGTGANGKSVFVRTVGRLLGDYAGAASFETFLVRRREGPRNDVADLRGARFVSAIEAEKGQRLAESLVKSLTGGDRIKARFLYSEHFTYEPTFKLWLAANHKPVVRGADLAIWRRIRLVPFTVAIPEAEQDRHIGEKLAEELPGILRWAAEGCLAWQREGLRPPPEVRSATAAYREESDPLAEFLADCCAIGDSLQTRFGDLFAAYQRWAGANRIPERERLSNRAFGDRLSERGFDAYRDKKTRWRIGIGLEAQEG